MSDDIRVPRTFTSFCSEPLGGGGRNAPANLSDENIERVIHALCTSTIDCRSRVGFGDPSDYVDLGDLIRDMYEERKRLLAAPPAAQQVYPFWYDMRRYEVAVAEMKVKELKELVDCCRERHFYEERGGEMFFYGDNEIVDLRNCPHLFDCIYGTMFRGLPE